MQKNKRVRPIVGAVLSGGLSTRMGMPKDRIVMSDGRLMIQHVIDTLLLVCNEVLVAGPKVPLSLEENERVSFVKDANPGQGPLAGIEAVLSTGIAKGYLIAACDQPLLKEDLLRKLIPEDMDMPCFFDANAEDFIQPFPGYYPVKWLPDVRDSLRNNRRAIKALIAESDVILRPFNKEIASCLQSINTREELQALSSPKSDQL
jgi:molybdopterin-guanine dinucleotide biosynthesis protein A